MDDMGFDYKGVAISGIGHPSFMSQPTCKWAQALSGLIEVNANEYHWIYEFSTTSKIHLSMSMPNIRSSTPMAISFYKFKAKQQRFLTPS